MLLAKSELLPLEDENRLNLIINLEGLELIDAHEIGDSEFEHVQQVLAVQSPEGKIFWPLFLIVPDHEETAVLLGAHLLDGADVVEGMDIVSLPQEQLRVI